MKRNILSMSSALAALAIAGASFGQTPVRSPLIVKSPISPATPMPDVASPMPGVASPMPAVGSETVTASSSVTLPYEEWVSGDACCSTGWSHGRRHCNVQWLIPWTYEDLHPEPSEPDLCGCRRQSFLWCPPEEEEDACTSGNGNDGNGNGNSNGNGNGNGTCEEAEEEQEEDLTPLMAAIKCRFPGHGRCKDEIGVNITGFLQMGFTGNFDSPRDRLNFGVNNNNRSNDFLLNQFYLIFERPVDPDNYSVGWRVDFLGGADAFENAVLERGFLDHAWSAGTYSYGIDLPQFYATFHMPILTKRGIDIQVGHIYTLMGYEVWPATDTPFYSRSYESFYGIPFTHTGVGVNTYIGDTLDLHNGMYVGWDNVFEDNNNAWTYMGSLSWTSCDGKSNSILSWITGPEQDNNEQDYRTVVTLNYTRTFGSRDQWSAGAAAIGGWDAKAGANGEDAQWYGVLGGLYYTLDPRVILGTRGEWFADPQGTRTGFNTDYYAVTCGVTLKPYQNLRVRPEIRLDWAGYDNVTPYNDQTDNMQTTAGLDLIWDF